MHPCILRRIIAPFASLHQASSFPSCCFFLLVSASITHIIIHQRIRLKAIILSLMENDSPLAPQSLPEAGTEKKAAEDNSIAITPEAPYYAVIFTSIRTEGDNGYGDMTDLMCSLAIQQPGYLGMESARGEAEAAVGITVSYWDSLESIRSWKMNLDHRIAQKRGKDLFYTKYKVRITKVERDYYFEAA
jgi:heme-degrading monooxygenase HmoA